QTAEPAPGPGAAAPSAAPSPFAGLTPCAKDAPEGQGCTTGKAATAPKPDAKADADVVWSVPIGPDSPARGAADPLVTIVVFSDFECPFCRKTADMLPKILEENPAD